MMEDKRERKHRRLRKWRIAKIRFAFLPLIASLFMSLIFIGSAGGGGIPGQCVNLNGCNFSSGPITFVQSLIATPTSPRTAQATINVTTSELIVLGIPTEAASISTTSHDVLSVLDSVGNIYTFAVHGQASTFHIITSWESYELWYSFVSPAVNLQIFVTWKTPGDQIFFVSAYRNAFGLGNTAHLDNVTLPNFGNTQTVNIVESKNGGWIVGGAIVADGSTCTIVAVVGQTQRRIYNYTMSAELSISDLQDKVTTLPGTNTYSEKFQSSCSPVSSTVALVAAEIIPQNDEQLNECTSTNNLCPVGTPPLLTQIQHGFISCTISSGSPACQSALSNFSPSYSVKPWFHAWYNLTGNIPLPTRSTIFTLSPAKFAFQSGDNGVVTGIIWPNMPLGLTELYGASDMRLDWRFNGGWAASPVASFCVNLDTSSNNNGAFLKPQYSSDMITWNDFSPNLAVIIDPGAGLGTICTSSNLTLPALNSYSLRVVGVGGGGALDNPAFGNIEMSIYPNGSFNSLIPCAVFASTVTATQYRVGMNCGTAINNGPLTYNVDWIAGIIQ